MKKILTFTAFAIILLGIFAFLFFNFSNEGYCASVKWHGFDEIAPNIFVDKNWQGDKAKLLDVTGKAKQRVTDFFGELKSKPSVIITDDKLKILKLGNDHNTITFAFFGAHSYITLSSDWIAVDIIAHEMTHAETHSRIFKGKTATESPLPIWFDEGLAVQNDYRDIFSDKVWSKITENGTKLPSKDTYDTKEEFYAGDTAAKRIRYCIAAHDVKEWISTNGKDKLLSLLDKINKGNSFDSLWNNK